MKTSLFAATSVAILLAAFAFSNLHAEGQAPPRAAAPSMSQHGIAVVDVTYILDHYNRLKQATDAFKADMEGAEAALKKERETIAKKAEKLKSLKPGTPDFKNLEEEMIKAESDWKLKVARQKSDFAERDAKNYLSAYGDIVQQVKVYSERHGISLVLRFNGAPVDPNNREMVQAEVFKLVMHYSKDIDITDPILAELNRAAAVATPPRGAAPRR